MNFLQDILTAKSEEVKEYYKIFPNGIISEPKQTRSLYRSLMDQDTLSVIAEIKRGSPSKGHFAPGLNVKDKVIQYESFGATAISVLTDRQFFFGGYQDLREIRPLTNLPILCKDFFIDKIQIDIAKYYGADVILLIAAALTDEKLFELSLYAAEKNLEVIMEVHNEKELERALSFDPKILGINNRNLKTFKTDIETSISLSRLVSDPSIAVISESGIASVEDAMRISKSGFKGILVGESLIRNTSSGKFLNEISMIRRV